MNPWFETVFAAIIALSGLYLGKAFANLQRPWWFAGYLLPLAVIAIVAITGFNETLGFLPPFCWFATGRIKFVTLSLAATTGLATLLPHLHSKFQKFSVRLLVGFVVLWFSVLPFLTSALIKNDLLNLKPLVDSQGFCFQTKDYTCGPAAAVTALGKLGLSATEGQIAILAHSNPITGTLPSCLYSALKDHYDNAGLVCDYARFNSIAELRNTGITLAPVRDSFLSNHCVAILNVSDKMVTFADPVLGKKTLSHAQFEKIWRFSGITLSRKTPRST